MTPLFDNSMTFHALDLAATAAGTIRYYTSQITDLPDRF
jgi:hypothetical protein